MWRSGFLLLGFAWAVAGCSAGADPLDHRSQARAAPPASYGAYVLRPNDQLKVQVFNEPNISGDYQVDASGFVSIPLAGRVRAGGLTAAQLERSISAGLNRGMIKDPRVNVQIANHAPFFIHGEVKRSGEFPYRPGLTVMDAVATAGGFTYRANERVAYLRRAGTGAEQEIRLDAAVPIFPGDNLRIAERFF
jgi:protein involved in polysaccharide export with SLBB domain